MATATLAAPKAAIKGTRVFENLPLHTWQVSKKHKPRQWVLITLPFREAMELFEAREYDMDKRAGEQRPSIDSWINKLRREMEVEAFAPAIWSACLRDSQRRRMVVNPDGTVTLTVTSQSPFALIDGNHRKKAMMKLFALAEKKQDQETMDLVDACQISVQVYLEPERSLKTFQALQEGKKVSPDLLAIQKFQDAKTPEEEVGLRVAVALNQHRDSHLKGVIGFIGPITNLLGVRTALTDSPSELACSIMGGVNIAFHFQKAKSGKEAVEAASAWLQQCYLEVWDAVQNHTDQSVDGFGQPIASVLMPGKMLRPLGYPGGRKAGTTLINGLANMWAYMKGVRGHDKMSVVERNHFTACVDQIFDLPNTGGLGGPQKRTLMGQFAREYFDPIVLSADEKPRAGKVSASDSIPRELRNHLMTPGAFGPVSTEASSLPSDGTLYDDEAEEEVEEEATPVEPPKSKGGSKPREA
jgi:hypothetical protein